MKTRYRVISYALVIIALFTCLTFPVSADPYDIIQDFLADGTFSPASLVFDSGKPLGLNPVTNFRFYYIEFIVRGAFVSSATYGGRNLSVVSLGNDFYKLSYSIASGSSVLPSSNDLFVTGSGVYAISSIRGYRSSPSYTAFTFSGNSQLFSSDQNRVSGSSISSSTSGGIPTNASMEVSSSSGFYPSYQFKLSIPNANKFDYFQYDLVVSAGSIGSVTSSIPKAVISYDVTPFTGDVGYELFYLHILVDTSNVVDANNLDLYITGAPASNGNVYSAKLTVSSLYAFLTSSDLTQLNFIQRIGAFFSSLGTKITSGFTNVVNAISNGLTSAVNAVKTAVDGVKTVVTNIYTGVTSGFNSVTQLLKDIKDGLADMTHKAEQGAEKTEEIKDGLDSVNSAEGSVGSANDALGSMPDNLSKLPPELSYSGGLYLTALYDNPIINLYLLIASIFMVIGAVFSMKWWAEK